MHSDFFLKMNFGAECSHPWCFITSSTWQRRGVAPCDGRYLFHRLGLKLWWVTWPVSWTCLTRWTSCWLPPASLLVVPFWTRTVPTASLVGREGLDLGMGGWGGVGVEEGRRRCG